MFQIFQLSLTERSFRIGIALVVLLFASAAQSQLSTEGPILSPDEQQVCDLCMTSDCGTAICRDTCPLCRPALTQCPFRASVRTSNKQDRVQLAGRIRLIGEGKKVLSELPGGKAFAGLLTKHGAAVRAMVLSDVVFGAKLGRFVLANLSGIQSIARQSDRGPRVTSIHVKDFRSIMEAIAAKAKASRNRELSRLIENVVLARLRRPLAGRTYLSALKCFTAESCK